MHRYFSFEEINSIWNVTGGCCSINSAKLRNFLCHRAHWIYRQSIPVRVQVGKSSMEKIWSFQFLDTVYQNWRNSRSNSTGKCGGSPLRFVWREVFNEGQSWLRNSSKLQGKWIRTTFLKVNDFSCRHCRDLRNFNSMFAIISGLEKPAIRRLHSSWERVSGYFILWISPKMANLQKIHENAGRHSATGRSFPKHVQIQTTPGWGFSRTTGKLFCFLLNLMNFYYFQTSRLFQSTQSSEKTWLSLTKAIPPTRTDSSTSRNFGSSPSPWEQSPNWALRLMKSEAWPRG